MKDPTPDPAATFSTREGVQLFWREDYLGPPWLKATAEVVVLLHGIGESSSVWYGWLATLAGQRRVISLDWPGHGRSAIAAGVPYEWSPDRLASDAKQLLESLGISRFHLVGAKYGASIAVRYAALDPGQVLSLSVVSGPVQVAGSAGAATVRESHARVRSAGVRTWADESMDSRLGTGVSAAQRAWWTDLMASTDERALLDCLDQFSRLDLRDSLPRIAAPTLFLTASGNALMARDGFEAWARAVPHGRLVVLDGNCYHPAAVKPAESSAAVLAHIESVRTG